MIDIIKSLVTLFFALSVMYMLLECKIKLKKNIYLFGIFVAALLICYGFVLVNSGYVTFMKFYPLLVYLPVFSAFVFLSRFNIIKVFFVHMTTAAITLSCSLIGLIFSYFFDSSRTVIYVVTLMLYISIWFSIYRYLRPTFLYMLNNTEKGWLGFCTIPLSYTALLYFSSRYNLDTVLVAPILRNSVFILILTIAAYALILRLFKQTREQLTLQNEQNLLQMQVTAAQAHLEALKESQEKTILYRHDMRHHLNLIDAYLTDNNKAAAQDYIKAIEKSIESAVVEKYCTNYTVNLILSSYIAKAMNEQISVETQIDLPEKNTVSDMDLCIIFANALENALNACKHIPGTNSRTLKNRM
jgi:two-component system sensor histidine kinase AgrC